MSVAGRTRTICLLMLSGLLATLSGWGAEPSHRQPIEYLRAEIESRKAELADVQKQRFEHKATTDRKIAALKAENTALRKAVETQEQLASRREESGRVRVLALGEAMKRIDVLIQNLTVQVRELRVTVDRAFSPKPDDKPPATSPKGGHSGPKKDFDANPFGR